MAASGVIQVQVRGEQVPVARQTFELLLGNSPARRRAAYGPALAKSSIKFDDLIDLARAADVPYVLLFGSHERAQHQVRRKDCLILNGMSKDTFALNSRSDVTLADVELIVKDLIRKQQELKARDMSLKTNAIVGCLKGSRRGVAADADLLRDRLGVSLEDLRTVGGKNRAFDLLVAKLEASQLLVSQSQESVMLQQLPRGHTFSGFCVKDKKIPYLFITGSEGEDAAEPAGRRILTLAVLASMVARNDFRVLTFDAQTPDPFPQPQWELAEELLMPRDEFRDWRASDVDDVREGADHFCVTPSAFTMRARRLEMIDRDTASRVLNELRAATRESEKGNPRTPLRVTALRKYAGREYTQRMLRLVDIGKLGATDFCRIVTLNRLRPADLPDLRARLR